MQGGVVMDETSRPPVAAVAAGISAVSWAAILAGAAVAIASSLALFALVSGLDLASMASPRSSPGSQVAIVAIGLIVTQWVSACLGGYITGRLRTRWIGLHTHEVFFRDTAHGLITWCVATIVVASGITAASSAGVMHNRAFERMRLSREPTELAQPAYAAGYAVEAAAADDGRAADELVVPVGGARETGPARAAEPLAVARTVLVPASTGGLSPHALFAELQGGADNESLHKDAALTSILTSLSMLIGAFIASVSGALGGRLRDEHG
jgi:hypothetical protein